jgi:hypothetical protein
VNETRGGIDKDYYAITCCAKLAVCPTSLLVSFSIRFLDIMQFFHILSMYSS